MNERIRSLPLPVRAMIQRMLGADEGGLTAEEEIVLRLRHGIGERQISTICPEVLSPLTRAAVLADFAARRYRIFLP